ncbi:MAG: ATP-binding protein [Candidatus Saccharimonadales bacterium]
MSWHRRLLALILLTHLLPLLLLWIILEMTELTNLSLVLLLPLLTAFLFSWALYCSLSRPLSQLSADIEKVAAGNLSTRAGTLPGVFGQISTALDTITSKLQEFVSRTQAETEVMAAEANRLRMILNSISDGVFALDSDKRIILFNKAASNITGLNIKAVAGQPVNTVLPLIRQKQLILSEWFDQCQDTDMQQTSWENVTFTNREGEELTLDIDALYIGADPNGVRLLVTFHNRTEERRVEDMKVDFVALAAHELRTPVTIIKGYLEILEEEVGPQLAPEHREFIRKLEVSATQLSGSINNILHVSRIEHGELNMNRETHEWNEIVRTVASELNQKAIAQGKSLLLNPHPKELYVSVDQVSITEVITNLIDNAIKYSKRGQKITVNVNRSKTGITTEIVDQGVGIPANAVGKLFTKFYRSHRTRTSHRGTGLGLYMSKSIVEAHGGRIWVESKEGEGSTFGFELPEVAKDSAGSDNGNITRSVHGWIKNHSLYRG